MKGRLSAIKLVQEYVTSFVLLLEKQAIAEAEVLTWKLRGSLTQVLKHDQEDNANRNEVEFLSIASQDKNKENWV